MGRQQEAPGCTCDVAGSGRLSMRRHCKATACTLPVTARRLGRGCTPACVGAALHHAAALQRGGPRYHCKAGGQRMHTAGSQWSVVSGLPTQPCPAAQSLRPRLLSSAAHTPVAGGVRERGGEMNMRWVKAEQQRCRGEDGTGEGQTRAEECGADTLRSLCTLCAPARGPPPPAARPAATWRTWLISWNFFSASSRLSAVPTESQDGGAVGEGGRVRANLRQAAGPCQPHLAAAGEQQQHPEPSSELQQTTAAAAAAAAAAAGGSSANCSAAAGTAPQRHPLGFLSGCHLRASLRNAALHSALEAPCTR